MKFKFPCFSIKKRSSRNKIFNYKLSGGPFDGQTWSTSSLDGVTATFNARGFTGFYQKKNSSSVKSLKMVWIDFKKV